MFAQKNSSRLYVKKTMSPLLALSLVVAPTAWPQLGVPSQGPPIGPSKPHVTAVMSVMRPYVSVSPAQTSNEFPASYWTVNHSFFEATEMTLKWTNSPAGGPAAMALWQLYKLVPASAGNRGNGGRPTLVRQTIASGTLPGAPFAATTVAPFKVNFAQYLPKYNMQPANGTYYLSVFAYETAFGAAPTSASTAAVAKPPVESAPVVLVHRPKSEMSPQITQFDPPNPYECVPHQKHRRLVTIHVPQVTVHHTTSNDDRDELYVHAAQLGPGPLSGDFRLPGPDNYYPAEQSFVYHDSAPPGMLPWMTKDYDAVPHPLVFQAGLNHGETATVGITFAEQDNAELKSIKEGIITVLHGIAGVSTAIGGYGLIVAAVAEALAAGNAAFVPDIDRHDLIGYVLVKITNQCGYIQTRWVTLGGNTPVGDSNVSNKFLKIDSQQPSDWRAAVLSLWPATPGVNYGEYEHVNQHFYTWLDAHGTNDSWYRFILQADVQAQ